MADETSGLRLIVGLASRTRHAGARMVCSMVATPTASYLESTVRTAPTDVDDGYLEVGLRFAKRAPEDIVIRIAVTNRGLRPAVAELITQLGSSDDEGALMRPRTVNRVLDAV